MDLKIIKKNYKKKNRNSFEILQYLLYILIPDLKEKFSLCEKAVNIDNILKEQQCDNFDDLYNNYIVDAENILKHILEVKKASLKDLKEYITQFSTISNDFQNLNELIEIFRENVLTENKIENGIKIFMAECCLFLARADIDLVIEKISKK